MIIPLAFCLKTIPQRTSSEIYTEKLSLRDSLTFIQRRSYPRTMEPLWPDGGSKIPRYISGTFHRYPSQIEILRRTPSETDSRRRNGTTLSRSEEHTSELQSHSDLVCRLLLEKKKKKK